MPDVLLLRDRFLIRWSAERYGYHGPLVCGYVHKKSRASGRQSRQNAGLQKLVPPALGTEGAVCAAPTRPVSPLSYTVQEPVSQRLQRCGKVRKPGTYPDSDLAADTASLNPPGLVSPEL